jgi:type I restriction enzyme S subunit
MSEWKDCKLVDIIDFGNGKSRPRGGGNIPVYGGNGILGYTNVSNYDGETIIIGRVGAYCGATYYEEKPVWVSDNALSAKSKDKNNAKFLFYLLKNMDLNQHAGGSSHPLVTQALLNSLDVKYTDDILEQCAIAGVLSSLDDKIDLLHRQNKTLENMAETLFRQWFIKEAKEEWEKKILNKVVDIGIGRTPPRKEVRWFSNNPQDIKWISIKDLGDSGVFIFDTSEYLTKEAVKTFNIPIIPKDTVLLSFKMTVGRVGVTTEPMLSNEAIAHFTFNTDTPFTKEYLYLFLKTFEYDSLGSTSSIVTAINSSMIKEFEVVIPDEGIMQRFRQITLPVFNKIKQNQLQIRNLEKMRDMLLPKLMSGEVRVEYAVG